MSEYIYEQKWFKQIKNFGNKRKKPVRNVGKRLLWNVDQETKWLTESNAAERSTERRTGNCSEDLETWSPLVILRRMASLGCSEENMIGED